MIKWVKNTSGSSGVWAGQTIADNAYYQIEDLEEIRWQADSGVLSDIGSGDLTMARDNSGTEDIIDVNEAINFLKDVSDTPKDPDKREIVHQTSRKRGLITYFMGAGDDASDPHDIGGGSVFSGKHSIGESASQTYYVDLNTINNETHAHEGYLQWKDAVNDTVTMEIVPKTTTYSAGSNTNYDLYGGYLIIPAAGTGSITVADADRVLVQVPTNEFGERNGAGYWDATWNTTTKQFDSITANALGTGEFNMFGLEVVLDRFVNQQPLLGSGFMQLQTSDASMLGHNMRFKLTIKTIGADHDWWWNASLVMHRKKTA